MGLGSIIIYLKIVGWTKQKNNMHKWSNPHVTNFKVL